ncbi:hypothetical protein Scep_017772 [Stephania cephalantha]|uniref:BHLH domain-containing protein n=1 Tax=Stephania cephalantha TaxID=152367 RepID=A0AAP0NV89_9MAGN
MEKGSSSVVGRQRKDVEKNRRIRMRNLFFYLKSLIPLNNNSKKGMSINELVEHATRYIKQKEEKVERMKKMKEKLQLSNEGSSGSADHENTIEVRDAGSTLEVLFMTNSSSRSNGRSSLQLLGDIICILKEEGAEVISANFHDVGGVTHHTIHSQAYCSRVGVETDRICERLQELNKTGERSLH